MLHLVRANPGLLIVAALFAGGLLVCTLLGFLMFRAGASLRPVYWFAGFFGLVVLPQLAGHLWKATRASSQEAPHAAALDHLSAGSQPADRTEDARTLFGPDVDPQLVVDMRQMFAGLPVPAEFAQFAALPSGESVLLARFPGRAATEQAWVHYLHISGLGQMPGKGDSERGFAVTRPAGDRAYALPMTTMLGVWTGADDNAIRQRMAAGGFEVPHRAPLALAATADSSTAADANSSSSLPVPGWLVAIGLSLYLFIVVLFFFKGSAWAGSSTPQPGTTAVSGADLSARLETVNTLDVPFSLERGTHAHELIATWRYADAKWVDLARARGMRRTFRIRMVLDESSRTVRATDYAASYDWSAGPGGAEVAWKSGLGIVFFHYEHQRVFGLQIDEHGRPTNQLSYAYTFNLAEMKSPLIDVVTKSGWTWRPTVWQGPSWLRWLTE